MRLIDTKTLKLAEHPDSRLPEDGYAILSHRWFTSDEEVQYENLESGEVIPRISRARTGFSKLQNFCSVALSKGYRYGWSDTCCINKGSATELGSALNSMYRWYANSKLCIVYLHDVYEGGKTFTEAEWFDRGWTLQELIAPINMEFFNRDWESIGTKDDLLELLSERTGIPIDVLDRKAALESCSVAQRMSWAAHRTTEREEDRAYSLLGIFDVSLEMIYGEREKAFIRLQERIIHYSADQSIFTWSMGTETRSETGYSGLLATSPSAFAACGDILKGQETAEFSMGNLGLKISLPTLPYDMETYLAFLDCTREAAPEASCTILVGRLETEKQWARIMDRSGQSVFSYEQDRITLRLTIREICVRQIPTEPPICFKRTYGFWLRNLKPPHHESSKISILSRMALPGKDRVLLEPGSIGTCGIVYLAPNKASKNWSRVRWIEVGFDDDFVPVVLIANDFFSDSSQFEEAQMLGPGSSIHNKVFNRAWVRSSGLRDNQIEPTSDKWDPGYKIFVHHRGQWPDYEYECSALNLSIQFSLLPDCEPGMTTSSPKLIWTIDVKTLRGPSSKSTRIEEGVAAWTTTLFGVLLIPTPFGMCCPVFSEGRKMIRQHQSGGN